MAETQNSPTKSVKFLNPGRRTNLSLQGKIYIVRLLFCLSTLTLLFINDAYCKDRASDHLWLIAGGLLYPQLGHLLFGRLDINRRRGHALFLADGMFIGAVTAALDYALLPGMLFVIISLFNWMVVGGFILVSSGLLFMLLGMLTVGTPPDLTSLGSAASCDVTNGLASLIAIGYFMVVARLIHKLIGELRLQQVGFQARSDTANSAKAMAEQALLAVLPASAARQMAAHGTVTTETIPEATILLLDLRKPNGSLPELEVMQDVLLVCDSIMDRHGIDLVRSLGSRILAYSNKESGANDAVKAFLEIANYFKDHEIEGQLLRGILHSGSVTVGLVHSQRLCIDLFGPAMDELGRLEDELAARQLSGLIVTASADEKLKNPPYRTRILTGDFQQTCYEYSA